MTLNAVTAAFHGGPRYLDTTNYGLLPRLAIERMRQALHELGAGSFDTETRNDALEAARRGYATLMRVDAARVAIAGSASEFVGLVASSVPDGSKVLIAEDDFTSLTLPFVVHKDRLNVVEVPVNSFVDALDDSIDFAAVSAAQSGDGAVIDLEALAAKRLETQTKVLLDTTQAASWLAIDAGQFDVVVTAAYKWLLCPRGTAFAYFSAQMTESIRPIFAGWFAAEDIHTGYYGSDVPLAASARRFDLSPSGINWIGAEPAIDLIVECGVENINRHNIALANQFRSELGLPTSNSAIVSTPISAQTIDKLRAADVAFGVQDGKRAGYGRFAFHLYNTADDVTAALMCFR